MENFAITLVCIALLIAGAVSICMTALNAVNSLADSLRQEEVLSRNMVNTSISCQNAATAVDGSSVTLTVANTGNTSIYDYKDWDVIVRYQNGDTLWIPYTAATPGWISSGFFFPGPAGNIPAQYPGPG